MNCPMIERGRGDSSVTESAREIGSEIEREKMRE